MALLYKVLIRFLNTSEIISWNLNSKFISITGKWKWMLSRHWVRSASNHISVTVAYDTCNVESPWLYWNYNYLMLLKCWQILFWQFFLSLVFFFFCQVNKKYKVALVATGGLIAKAAIRPPFRPRQPLGRGLELCCYLYFILCYKRFL